MTYFPEGFPKKTFGDFFISNSWRSSEVKLKEFDKTFLRLYNEF